MEHTARVMKSLFYIPSLTRRNTRSSLKAKYTNIAHSKSQSAKNHDTGACHIITPVRYSKKSAGHGLYNIQDGKTMRIEKSFTHRFHGEKWSPNNPPNSRNVFITRTLNCIRFSAAARDILLPTKYLRIDVTDKKTIRFSRSSNDKDYTLNLFNGQAAVCYQYLKHFIDIPAGKRILLQQDKDGSLFANIEESSEV